MKKEIAFILTCFFSLYSLTEEEEKAREVINKIYQEDQTLQCINFEDIVKEVDYMKKKKSSWNLNEENELKTFHSTMNRYIKESNGAVFVDKGGKKYTINDVKIIYHQNIFYKYLVGSFIVYKVATWTYYKIKKSFFDDEEFQSNKYSNKKNEKNDEDRENI